MLEPNGFSAATQKWLITFLVFWLIFIIARQSFDLIGKLWIPVAFNFLQILSCISGLFGAVQYRIGLLIGLIVTTILSIAYNIAIILWYGNFIGDRESSVLSAGLPYGYSFFLRHTPFCEAQFNLTLSRWEQNSNCVLPYYSIETLQAFMNIVIAVWVFVFCILTIQQRKRILQNKYATYVPSRSTNSSNSNKKSKATSSNNNETNQINVAQLTSALAGNKEKFNLESNNLNLISITAPDSINDLSGYMNSSYESQIENRNRTQNQQNFDNTLKINNEQNILHNSLKREETMSENDDDLPPPPPLLPVSNGAIPIPIPRQTTPVSFYQQNENLKNIQAVAANNPNASTRIYARNNTNSSSNRFRNRQSVNNNSLPESADISGEYLTPSALYALQEEHQKVSSFYTQPNKHANIQHSNPSLSTQKNPSNELKDSPNSSAESSAYLEYLSRNSERRTSSNNLTSLISFDPKSNTLIRVREHQNDSSEDEENFEKVTKYSPSPNVQNDTNQTLLLQQNSKKPMELIRQRIPLKPSTSTEQLANTKNLATNEDVLPDWTTLAGISHPVDYFDKCSTTSPSKLYDKTQPTVISSNIKNDLITNLHTEQQNYYLPHSNNTNSTPFYQYFEDNRPKLATDFPIYNHHRQRSIADVCVSSAFPLVDKNTNYNSSIDSQSTYLGAGISLSNSNYLDNLTKFPSSHNNNDMTNNLHTAIPTTKINYNSTNVTFPHYTNNPNSLSNYTKPRTYVKNTNDLFV